MKKIILFIFISILSISLIGCQMGGFQPTGSIELEEIDTLYVGDTVELTVTLTSLQGEVTFESSNEDVAVVDEEGILSAVSAGTTTITAKIVVSNKEYTDSIEVEVEPAPIKHEHEHCLICNKCTSADCDGNDDEKCLGHEVIHPTCETCGKCTFVDCNESTHEKCEGHEIEHNCTEHKSDWTIVGEVECGEYGTQVIKCTICGETLEEKTYRQNHEYKETVISEKTCTQNGEIKYTCLLCEYSYTDYEYSNGHEEDEIEIILEATDTTLGTKQIKCKHCNYIFKEFGYVNNAYHKNGKLSVVGPDLVNQYGDKVQLYGLSTHGLQWFSKVVNFDTICEIQENFGNNIIRFALYTDENGYCDGSAATKKMMLETLHRGIEIATDLGLYVIVDWHMVGAENVLDKNPLTYLEESKEFFSYMSEYYKDYDNILYEIMNEPNGTTTWADCKKYANEIIPLIRKNTDAIVLVGNPKWTADLNSVMKDPLVGYNNIMYTYHFYAADHTSTTQVVKAYDSGFPVFISEFGFMDSSGDGNVSETNGEKWKKVLDARNISYVAWNISNSKGSASIFKYNTGNLADVSDSNLKVWGVYLKNWYRAKSLNIIPEEEEIKNVNVELSMEIPDWSTLYECFIQSPNHSDSRLDYTWSSTNEAVLSVSEYSSIRIYGDGNCSIVAVNKTTGATGVLDVVVKNGQIESWTSRFVD